MKNFQVCQKAYDNMQENLWDDSYQEECIREECETANLDDTVDIFCDFCDFCDGDNHEVVWIDRILFHAINNSKDEIVLAVLESKRWQHVYPQAVDLAVQKRMAQI